MTESPRQLPVRVLPRRRMAVAVGRLAGSVSRLLRRGGGTSLPGHLALKTDPSLIAGLAGQLSQGCVLVTGTNGKTTTARMISQILEAAGLSVVRNATGANMTRGIATSLLERSDWSGRLRLGPNAIGVFEVDEAVFPSLAPQVPVCVAVLLNVFRDQLDRYGEVARIPSVWAGPLGHLPSGSTVVANADDPLIVDVASRVPGVCWFGLDVADQGLPDYGGDVKSCPRCGSRIDYRRHYYGHLGEFCCRKGDLRRPEPAVQAGAVDLQNLDSTAISIRAGADATKAVLPLPGLYNVSNAAAAAAAALTLGVDLHVIGEALKNFTSAFGRMEQFDIEGRLVHLLLAKNPTGYNQTLRTIFARRSEPVAVLFLLNDNAADGRDVSWIWDVDFEMAAGRIARAVCGGTRADDMALRLKYAGVTPTEDLARTFPDPEDALHAIIKVTQPGQPVYVFATYSAMLSFRTILTRRGYATPYWSH